MFAKGRNKILRGADKPDAKLTAQNVIEIKKALADGARLVDLAEKYKVTKQNISNIKRGDIWKHIPSPLD